MRHNSPYSSKSWSQNQPREITPDPKTNSKVHRHGGRLPLHKSFSASRKNHKNSKGCPPFPNPPLRFGASCPTSFRAHGIDDGRHPTRQAQNEVSAGMASLPVQPSDRPPVLTTVGNTGANLPTRLVNLPRQPPHRQTFLPPATFHTGHNRCQPHGMGCPLPSAHSPRALVNTRTVSYTHLTLPTKA